MPLPGSLLLEGRGTECEPGFSRPGHRRRDPDQLMKEVCSKYKDGAMNLISVNYCKGKILGECAD